MNRVTYEQWEKIGQGEFATVWRGYDHDLKRHVAIKELHEQLRQDPQQMEEFWQEAQFLANQRHDNIVQIYGLDKERGWIIMELMRGSLDQLIGQAPLPPDQVRSVLQQTLQGLAHLHQQNKLHVAVKPANLLIDNQGRVKLSDFAGTVVGGVIRQPKGSAKYLAPELLDPAFGPVGPGVDLYQLGFTALELLMGPRFESQFQGVGPQSIDPEMAWMRWHSSASSVLPAVARLVPRVPSDLAHVIDRLLRKSVTERYPSAAAALADLEKLPIVEVVLPPDDGDGAEDDDVQTHLDDIPMVTRRFPFPSPHEEGETQSHGVGGAQAPPLRASVPGPIPPPSGPGGGGGAKPPRGSPVEAGTNGMRERGQTVSTKQQIKEFLSRPYVLYPLICVLLLGALVLILFLPRPKPTPSQRDIPVRTVPRGATVYLDGKKLGKKTDLLLGLPLGTYKLRFELENYESQQMELVVTEDEPREGVEIKLKSKGNTNSGGQPAGLRPGNQKTIAVRVRTEPEKADIYIDGEKKRPVTPATFELSPGTYRITVVSRGESQSKVITLPAGAIQKEVSFTFPPLSSTKPGRALALLVGVSSPSRELPVFRHAEADVRALARVLLEAGYERKNVVVLTSKLLNSGSGEQATAAQIRKALGNLVRECQPTDRLLLVLAGHVIRIPPRKEVFFCPEETIHKDQSTLVSLSEAHRELDRCRADTKVLLLDVCRRPLKVDGKFPEGVVPDAGLTTGHSPSKGVAVLSSCSSGQRSNVHPGTRHGLFFHLVIQGMVGAADANKDRDVSLSELEQFVRERTASQALTVYRQSQVPKRIGLAGRDPWLGTPSPALKDYLRGLDLLDRGKYQEADNAFRAALKRVPQFLDAYLGRAIALYHLRDFDLMLTACQQAEKIDPNNAAAYDYQGDALASRMNPDGALSAYKQAIRIDPHYAPVYNSRGVVYERQGKWAEALNNYQQAVELSPVANPKFLVGRGNVHLHQNNFKKAIEDFSAAIKLSQKKDAQLYRLRGLGYLKLKQYKLAVADFDSAIAIDRNQTFSYRMRAIVHYEQKDYNKAMADANKVLEVFRMVDAEMYYIRGVGLARKGKYSDAIEDFTQALKYKYPSRASVYRWRAWCHEKNGDPVRAKADEARARLEDKSISTGR